MSATYLDRIMSAHRAAAAEDPRSFEATLAAARAVEAPVRGFAAALGRSDRLDVVAELKRRSPSRGDLRIDVDPGALASAYASGGATCLSVLTDAEFFGGSADDLRAAHAACALPVLRKDFTVSPADVCDARLMGADAVLLIAAALDDDELRRLRALAGDLDLDALVEVHDEAELERALVIGAVLVGVNQRDLTTFAVDSDRALRMAGAMPDHVIRIAESGVRGAEDAQRLADAGYHAVLVGESLVTADDPAGAVGALRVGRRAGGSAAAQVDELRADEHQSWSHGPVASRRVRQDLRDHP